MLTLKLLGASAIYLDNKLLTLKTNKSQALLYYLVINEGYHSRDLLADLLWPHMNTQQARKNLRDTLSHLRAHIDHYLLVDRQKLAFNQTLPYQCDVHEFIDKIERGRTTMDLALTEQGLTLYQGAFLVGLHLLDAAPFDGWANQQRAIYHRYALETLTWLTQTYLAHQRYAEGITSARRLLKLEPLQENIHRLLMQLLVLDGKRADALRQYDVCRQQLESAMGIAPSVETELLYAQMKDGRFPPAIDADTSANSTLPANLMTPAAAQKNKQTHTKALKHNLPRTFTPLIGRGEAVSQLQTLLLDPKLPLITLVGEGGVGKTRLALAAAQALVTPVAATDSNDLAPLHPFEDGIWFVDLSAVSADDQTAAQIGEAIAAAIGLAMNLRFTASGNLSHQVGIALRQQAALLILDNFEHLYTGVTYLVNLLQIAQSLQLLVTSRRRLALAAEYLVEVKGLAVPSLLDAAATLHPAHLLTYSAIHLFSECAHRAHPTFRLDESNGRAVLHICRRLDGLPLGIELAATQLATHSCQQIAEQLQQNYQILSTTRVDLPVRQHSMRAVLAASWQLLTADEALILASCTLLQAMFSLEAILVITRATPEQVRRLVHRTLLRHDTTTHRFQFHELVRQYSAEQLRAQPDTAQAVAQRHAEYFINLLAQQAHLLFSDPTQLQQINDHWENITAAWRWSIVAERFDLLQAGALALAYIYRNIGHLQEGINVFNAAVMFVRQQVDLMDSEPKQRLLVHLLSCTGEFYHLRSEAVAEAALATELMMWGERLDDLLIKATALNELACVAEINTDYPAMYTYSKQVLALLAGQHNAAWLHASSFISISIAALALGLFDEGLQSGLAALACLQQAPNREMEAGAYFMLGINCQRSKNFELARHYLTTARDLGQTLHNQRLSAFSQCYLGDLLCDLGDYGQAKSIYEELFTLDEIDYELDWRAWLHVSYGRLLQQVGDLAAAQSHYAQIVQQAGQPSLSLAAARAMLHLGGLLTELGEWSAAAASYQDLQTLLGETGLPHLNADLHAGLATLYLAQQQWSAAQAQVSLALTKLTAQGVAATEEPFLVYWRCICVLTATNDAQATVLLGTAHALVQTHAAAISDNALRHTFLTKVPAVVAIMAAAARDPMDKVYAQA